MDELNNPKLGKNFQPLFKPSIEVPSMITMSDLQISYTFTNLHWLSGSIIFFYIVLTRTTVC